MFAKSQRPSSLPVSTSSKSSKLINASSSSTKSPSNAAASKARGSSLTRDNSAKNEVKPTVKATPSPSISSPSNKPTLKKSIESPPPQSIFNSGFSEPTASSSRKIVRTPSKSSVSPSTSPKNVSSVSSPSTFGSTARGLSTVRSSSSSNISNATSSRSPAPPPVSASSKAINAAQSPSPATKTTSTAATSSTRTLLPKRTDSLSNRSKPSVESNSSKLVSKIPTRRSSFGIDAKASSTSSRSTKTSATPAPNTATIIPFASLSTPPTPPAAPPAAAPATAAAASSSSKNVTIEAVPPLPRNIPTLKRSDSMSAKSFASSNDLPSPEGSSKERGTLTRQKSFANITSPFSPSYVMTRNTSPDFIGMKEFLKKHSQQIIKFESWARERNWKKFHTSHFDFWVFPLGEKSNFDLRYSVFEEEVAQFHKDKVFMKNYLRGLELVALAWGWDMKNMQPVKKPDANRGQIWSNWPIRLYRAHKSASYLGAHHEYESLQQYAQTLIDGGYPLIYKQYNLKNYFKPSKRRMLWDLEDLEISSENSEELEIAFSSQLQLGHIYPNTDEMVYDLQINPHIDISLLSSTQSITSQSTGSYSTQGTALQTSLMRVFQPMDISHEVTISSDNKPMKESYDTHETSNIEEKEDFSRRSPSISSEFEDTETPMKPISDSGFGVDVIALLEDEIPMETITEKESYEILDVIAIDDDQEEIDDIEEEEEDQEIDEENTLDESEVELIPDYDVNYDEDLDDTMEKEEYLNDEASYEEKEEDVGQINDERNQSAAQEHHLKAFHPIQDTDDEVEAEEASEEDVEDEESDEHSEDTERVEHIDEIDDEEEDEEDEDEIWKLSQNQKPFSFLSQSIATNETKSDLSHAHDLPGDLSDEDRLLNEDDSPSEGCSSQKPFHRHDSHQPSISLPSQGHSQINYHSFNRVQRHDVDSNDHSSFERSDESDAVMREMKSFLLKKSSQKISLEAIESKIMNYNPSAKENHPNQKIKPHEEDEEEIDSQEDDEDYQEDETVVHSDDDDTEEDSDDSKTEDDEDEEGEEEAMDEIWRLSINQKPFQEIVVLNAIYENQTMASFESIEEEEEISMNPIKSIDDDKNHEILSMRMDLEKEFDEEADNPTDIPSNPSKTSSHAASDEIEAMNEDDLKPLEDDIYEEEDLDMQQSHLDDDESILSYYSHESRGDNDIEEDENMDEDYDMIDSDRIDEEYEAWKQSFNNSKPFHQSEGNKVEVIDSQAVELSQENVPDDYADDLSMNSGHDPVISPSEEKKPAMNRSIEEEDRLIDAMPSKPSHEVINTVSDAIIHRKNDQKPSIDELDQVLNEAIEESRKYGINPSRSIPVETVHQSNAFDDMNIISYDDDPIAYEFLKEIEKLRKLSNVEPYVPLVDDLNEYHEEILLQDHSEEIFHESEASNDDLIEDYDEKEDDYDENEIPSLSKNDENSVVSNDFSIQTQSNHSLHESDASSIYSSQSYSIRDENQSLHDEDELFNPSALLSQAQNAKKIDMKAKDAWDDVSDLLSDEENDNMSQYDDLSELTSQRYNENDETASYQGSIATIETEFMNQEEYDQDMDENRSYGDTSPRKPSELAQFIDVDDLIDDKHDYDDSYDDLLEEYSYVDTNYNSKDQRLETIYEEDEYEESEMDYSVSIAAYSTTCEMKENLNTWENLYESDDEQGLHENSNDFFVSFDIEKEFDLYESNEENDMKNDSDHRKSPSKQSFVNENTEQNDNFGTSFVLDESPMELSDSDRKKHDNVAGIGSSNTMIDEEEKLSFGCKCVIS